MRTESEFRDQASQSQPITGQSHKSWHESLEAFPTKKLRRYWKYLLDDFIKYREQDSLKLLDIGGTLKSWPVIVNCYRIIN